jgi:hypothetical protein
VDKIVDHIRHKLRISDPENDTARNITVFWEPEYTNVTMQGSGGKISFDTQAIPSIIILLERVMELDVDGREPT